MGSCGNTRPSDVLDGQSQMITMIESSTLAQITSYMVENKVRATLVAESQQKMGAKATIIEAK